MASPVASATAIRSSTTRLLAFVAASVLVGVMLAGVAMPVVGAAGWVARGTSEFYRALPTELTPPPLAQQSRVLYADGTPMATFYEEDRVVVPLSAIAPVLQHAVVAIEDSRFYEHGGVDPLGIGRALLNNLTGGSTQGGSTLTQQWVKNVLAEKARREGGRQAYEQATAKDYGRKIREARLAIAAEDRMSKDQILQAYLNTVLFGDGQYGAEAASWHFFAKPAAGLTLPEAALLAGMVQSPSNYDPVDHPDLALKRRDVVLARMLELGMVDKAQYDQAVAVPLQAMLHLQPTPNGCQQAGSAAFFCDYVLRTLLSDPALGATVDDRRDRVYRGGLTILTTLEKPRQDAAEAAVTQAVAPTDGAASALVSVQPGTGRIVALAQSRFYEPGRVPKPGGTSVNYSVDSAMGGAGGFQTGSSFKPFTLATWLASGRNLAEQVDAPPAASISYGELTSTCGRLVSSQPWVVGNNEGEGHGRTTVLQATFLSINTAYANMLRQLDLCDIYKTAKALGVHRADGREMPVYPSFILGTEEVAPLTMALAYAAFANSGVYCSPVAVSEVKDASGAVIAGQQPQCSQAIPPEVANGVAFALTYTLDRGTAACCDIPWPAGGKTGTTNDSTETWFSGFTRQLATSVWVGTPDASPASLRGVPLAGKQYPWVYGATVAAPTWQRYMSQAMNGLPPEEFAAPPPAMVGPLPDSLQR